MTDQNKLTLAAKGVLRRFETHVDRLRSELVRPAEGMRAELTEGQGLLDRAPKRAMGGAGTGSGLRGVQETEGYRKSAMTPIKHPKTGQVVPAHRVASDLGVSLSDVHRKFGPTKSTTPPSEEGYTKTSPHTVTPVRPVGEETGPYMSTPVKKAAEPNPYVKHNRLRKGLEDTQTWTVSDPAGKRHGPFTNDEADEFIRSKKESSTGRPKEEKVQKSKDPNPVASKLNSPVDRGAIPSKDIPIPGDSMDETSRRGHIRSMHTKMGEPPTPRGGKTQKISKSHTDRIAESLKMSHDQAKLARRVTAAERDRQQRESRQKAEAMKGQYGRAQRIGSTKADKGATEIPQTEFMSAQDYDPGRGEVTKKNPYTGRDEPLQKAHEGELERDRSKMIRLNEGPAMYQRKADYSHSINPANIPLPT
jgi:hypothetical protein